MHTYTLIDQNGWRAHTVQAATPEQAAEQAILLCRKLGQYSIGDAAGFATRNLRITEDAYLGGDNLRGLLVEFEVCGYLGPVGRGNRPNGEYASRTLRLVA